MTAELMYSAKDRSYFVQIDGLKDLIDWAKTADRELKKAVVKGLKEAASPVLERARANAARIQDDGTYKNSLAIASRKNGVQYILKSTDPAAPVKEYARAGARTRTSKGTPLANTRLRLRSGVGVPRGNPPRVMVPAVNDSTDTVIQRMESALAEVLEGAGRG